MLFCTGLPVTHTISVELLLHMFDVSTVTSVRDTDAVVVRDAFRAAKTWHEVFPHFASTKCLPSNMRPPPFMVRVLHRQLAG